MKKKSEELTIIIDGLEKGGAELYLTWLAPELKKYFNKIKIFTLAKELPLKGVFEEFGISAQQLTPWMLCKKIFFEKSIFYIHLAKVSFLAMIIGIIFKIFGKESNIFIHEHAAPHYFSEKKSFYKKVINNFYLLLIHTSLKLKTVFFIFPTNTRLKEVKNKYKKNDRCFAVKNSIPTKKINFLKNLSTPIPFDGRNIVMYTFSRLHEIKQIPWAIDAINNTSKKENINFILQISGEGPAEASLRLLSKNKKNVSIIFKGHSKIEDLSETSHIFLMPSKNEGFGISLLEAALTGNICVVNDCPYGPAEIAKHFPNILLATPPTKENFSNVVAKAVRIIKENKEINKKDSVWPDISLQAHRIFLILSKKFPNSSDFI